MSSKFQLKCSCIICKQETTIQSLKAHITKHHTNTCKHCNTIIDSQNTFCNQSCAATFNNLARSEIVYENQSRTMRERGHMPPQRPRTYHNTKCVICSTPIQSKKGNAPKKTCSTTCYSKHLSNMAIKSGRGGSMVKPITYRHKNGFDVSLDSSWELKLAQQLDEHNVQWERGATFTLSTGRRYTPDFYLPEYGIYIDPKAKRKDTPLWFEMCTSKIKMFEIEYHTTVFVIVNKKDLTWNHVKSLLSGRLESNQALSTLAM